MSPEAARVPALDGLRGLAIALVVAHHATQFAGVPSAPGWEQSVHAFGMELWLGVDLFFVLSGHLITGILLRTRERVAAVLLLVSGGVSMAVGWLGYHQFEARFLRLKDRFV